MTPLTTECNPKFYTFGDLNRCPDWANFQGGEGYEDLNDHDELRSDTISEVAAEALG